MALVTNLPSNRQTYITVENLPLDLDRAQLAAHVAELVLLLQRVRIKHAPPRLERPAADADSNAAHGSEPRFSWQVGINFCLRMRALAEFGEVNAATVVTGIHIHHVGELGPRENAQGQKQNCREDKPSDRPTTGYDGALIHGA